MDEIKNIDIDWSKVIDLNADVTIDIEEELETKWRGGTIHERIYYKIM